MYRFVSTTITQECTTIKSNSIRLAVFKTIKWMHLAFILSIYLSIYFGYDYLAMEKVLMKADFRKQRVTRAPAPSAGIRTG